MKRPGGSWMMPCLSPRRWEANDMGGRVLFTGRPVISVQEVLGNSHFPQRNHTVFTQSFHFFSYKKKNPFY